MSKSIIGFLFQVFGVGLLLLQAFIAPLILGLDGYGVQIMLLVPVFLAQALVEPAFQANLNGDDKSAAGFVDLTLCSFLFSVAAVVFVLTSAFLNQSFNALVALTFVLFVFNTLFQSRAFAMEKYEWATFAAFCQFVGYAVGLGLSHQSGLGQALIVANAIGFGLSSSFYLLAAISSGSIRFIRGRLSVAGLMDGISLRTPTLNVSILFLIALSKLGVSPNQIGAFRIFMSALNAGRYINLVSLQRLQLEIHRYIQNPERQRFTENATFSTYIKCLIFYLFCLTVMFPIFFSFFFTEAPFGHFSTFLSGFFILLQPFAYTIFALRRMSGYPVTPLFLSISIISLAFFSWLLLSGVSPFDALASGIIVIFLSLSAVIYYQVKYTYEANTTKPRNR